MSSVLYKWWPFASRPCIFFFLSASPRLLADKVWSWNRRCRAKTGNYGNQHPYWSCAGKADQVQKSNSNICGTVQNPSNSNSEEKQKTVWVIGGSSYLGGLNIKLVLKKWNDNRALWLCWCVTHFSVSPNIRSSQF